MDMTKFSLWLVIAASIVVLSASDSAFAGRHGRAERQASNYSERNSWHQPYYHTAWGHPVALVVPPTARTHTEWGWGVTQSTVTPIYHQFKRAYPGDGGGEYSELRPTPPWPSHTHQFGAYYIRGPW